MSTKDGDREGFLARWSRRKRGTETQPPPDAQASAPSAQANDAFVGFDFDSLNFSSDYTRFMTASVPEHVQRTALRKLWISTDIIARADDLDDYLEDFREEAMALPAEMVRSAYRIGRGIVDDRQDAEANETDEQLIGRDCAAKESESGTVAHYQDDDCQSESAVPEAHAADKPTDSDKLPS